MAWAERRPQLREVPQHLAALQLRASYLPALRIDGMRLEDALRNVQSNCRTLHLRLLPAGGSTQLPLWHIDAVALRGLLTASARSFIASPFRLATYKEIASMPPILRFNFVFVFECNCSSDIF